MDYTFTDVNQNSVQLAPMHAMQFGTAIHRIFHRLAYCNPTFGTALLSKIDLSDGYYRIPLSPSAALELAVVLPPLIGNKPVIGIPLVLPMGWKYSPPLFCAYTESATDLANLHIANNMPAQPHPLEHMINTIATPKDAATEDALHPPPEHWPSQPLAYCNVYMDDFLGLSQPNTATYTQRHMLHSIDAVFRATPSPLDAPNRKEVISRSKLANGDGTWSTQKLVLGWLLNTANKTLQLPLHKAERLSQLLSTFLPLKRTSRRRWQQLLGELRHMAIAIPGAKYLFSILQHVLVDQPTSSRLRLKPNVTASLQDWQLLAQNLAKTPTPIQSLVPTPPSFLGAVDASGAGLGGVWLPTPIAPPSAKPIVFRLPFPRDIQANLVTAHNPTGTLTNSDLELAALITGAAVLRSTYPGPHASLLCASNNFPAVSWLQKGSTSSTAPRAFLPCWLARLTRSDHFTLCPVFASGSTNTLADVCSRLFHSPDQEFFDTLQRQFPIPGGWTLVHPENEIVWQMTSALSGEMSPWASAGLAPMQPPTLGSCGTPFAEPSPWNPLESTSPILSHFYKSLPTATGKERYLPASLKFAAAQWATPFEPLGRCWPTWDSTTHA